MRALVWIVEETWETTVAQAAALLPAAAEVTLLHVASPEPEAIAASARHGLLGRPHHLPPTPLRTLSDAAAARLLADAAARLGRPAAVERRRGPVEHEVIAAAERADLLLLARDGDRDRLGPRSLGPEARFVVDHAPCAVVLLWPAAAPSAATLPPRPPGSPD